MATEVTKIQELPRDQRTGLILPLSKSLGSQDLAQQRAMVAVELEVMAKKMDRFGWDRDRGTHAHDRMISDWMDALQDFPLTEVKDACREWVLSNPRKMPNEGDIRGLVMSSRAKSIRLLPQPEPQSDPRVSKERAAEIMQEVGFKPKRFGGEA